MGEDQLRVATARIFSNGVVLPIFRDLFANDLERHQKLWDLSNDVEDSSDEDSNVFENVEFDKSNSFECIRLLGWLNGKLARSPQTICCETKSFD